MKQKNWEKHFLRKTIKFNRTKTKIYKYLKSWLGHSLANCFDCDPIIKLKYHTHTDKFLILRERERNDILRIKVIVDFFVFSVSCLQAIGWDRFTFTYVQSYLYNDELVSMIMERLVRDWNNRITMWTAQFCSNAII